MIAALKRFFLTPSDGTTLSCLRIVVGLAIFFECLVLFPHLNGLYGQYGYLQTHLMDALAGATIPGALARLGVSAESFSTLIHVLFFVQLVTALGFALGFKTKLLNWMLLLTQIFFINSGWISSYGFGRYLHNLVFLMAFFPVNRRFSIDLLRRGSPFPAEARLTLGKRLVQLFLLMTYVDAGLSKAAGTDWWTGNAVWRALMASEFQRFDLQWIAAYPGLLLFICWTTVFFESFYIVGYWIPRVRIPWVLAIIGMHLGIAIFMKLTLFGLTMAAVNAAVFLVPLLKKEVSE